MELVISDSITLKPLDISHAVELYQVIADSRENLSQFLPWVDDVIDVNSTKRYIYERLHSGKAGSQWFAVYIEDRLSGVFGIKHIDPDSKGAECGYWLADFARGQRAMNQVLTKIVPYIKNNSHAKVIEFCCLEENLASIKVVQRAGAQFKYYQKETSIFLANQQQQRLGVYEIKLT
ncbi:GNAT family N-acetyltransferase [Pseudoalteromonas sp. SG43-7]|uniref:GNAT family N-acetyltransferase n=2 Tax=Pseudoalteromonas TaxID=53246 RepID=UPI001601FD6A|nr:MULTISPECIES: GNAT family protein [unclassified Pseudoalteromonas]MBB1301065.1 GNAT family N-acetyltransferase [Pseudoalteromonas sp. SR44-8]MBB1308593.1 GNAT family N-acetyltransferase [Pseudoalteromonas sp. SR41-8]MBB1420729.1 GNAT family N-acetyltransferase [Pseudoalteromonas sp. SG43-7]MBB1435666.1 GNAT family N-acetyltransferase [Pseudoalteromonas sp. SG43-6]MBB1468514.1 GNAT family N-acetyltransferase [Pseudoalteromonas sp. SG41-5]|tara:strand:+ start:559 stop:1089 length:531 start_codon:yes stop_codon:yes gene_type:complete